MSFYSLTSYSQLRVNVAPLQGGGGGFSDTTSWEFDGIDSHLESVAPYTSLTAVDNYSISCWIYANSISGNQMIWQGLDSSGSSTHYGMLRATGRVDVWTGGSGSNWSRGTELLSSGQWYHVVMTLDKTLSNRYIRQKIFINAVSGFTSNFYGNDVNSSQQFSLGASPSGTNAFDGNINEFCVWDNHTLTPTEITEIYASGGPCIDMNTIATPPTSWYRSETSTWNGSKWTMSDVQGNEVDFDSSNLVESSRVNEVP